MDGSQPVSVARGDAPVLGTSREEQPRGRARRRVLLAALALVALAACGWLGLDWWRNGRFLESTDDAYLASDAVAVAPRVAGQVADVLVGDNQRVEAGALLARLDDRDYQAALASARADLQSAQADQRVIAAQAAQVGAQVAEAQADVKAADAAAGFATAEARRYADLQQTGYGTVQRAQSTQADIVSRQAGQARARAAQRSAEEQRDVLAAQAARADAQAGRAEAAVRQAALNLSYTRVTAPFAGAVGDRQVRVGQYVQPGTRLLTLVPVGTGIYALANFKETQLARLVPGERVRVAVDMLPGVVLDGVVDSLAPGSGAQFALLPPENATGNFTKIVQRVPVRVRLQEVPPAVLPRLRPGLSVTATADTRTAPAPTSP